MPLPGVEGPRGHADGPAASATAGPASGKGTRQRARHVFGRLGRLGRLDDLPRQFGPQRIEPGRGRRARGDPLDLRPQRSDKRPIGDGDLCEFEPDGNATQAIAVGDRIWFGAAEGAVVCLDRRTGRENWRFWTTGRIMSPPTWQCGPDLRRIGRWLGLLPGRGRRRARLAVSRGARRAAADGAGLSGAAPGRCWPMC